MGEASGRPGPDVDPARELERDLARLKRLAPGVAVVVPSQTYDELDARIVAERSATGSLSVKNRGASDECRLHEATQASKSLVRAGAIAGIRKRDIASTLGVSMETLLVHYGALMVEARTQANTQVGMAALKAATSGNVEAIKHWTKCRMGWKERTTKSLVGVQGGGLSIAIVIDG